jgi:hypothetical protein
MMRGSVTLILIVLFLSQQRCSGFKTNSLRYKSSSFQIQMSDNQNGDIQPKTREKFGGPEYFQGLITEPIASKTTKVDGKERDNLTPNLKFGAILSGVVFGLFELFMFANKDLAPPPY